jgi:arginine/lysine/ornithine decarboxylase
MDHQRAPILEALEAYHAAGYASYCIPAHRQGRAIGADTGRVLGADTFRNDVLLHKGLDDRTGSKQVLQDAQKLAADAFGADQTFFSTNGSTLSVQAAVIAAARPGEKILVQRNAHKSAVAGAALSGADVVWVDCDIDDERRLGHAVVPETLEAALAEHPDARAALCISPTYYGVAADIRGLADVCHRHDIPLLMDDAWGADFHFHPELPDGALECGADLAIGSFHKSLGGLLQSSVISVTGDRVDVERLQLALDSMETTSTSSLQLASIDAARRQMVLHGQDLLGRTLRIAREVADRLRAIPGLGLMGRTVTERPGAAGLDETKITVDLHHLGINGYDAADWLYAQRRVAVEGADYRHLMFLVAIGDDDTSVDPLVTAMTDLAAKARSENRPPLAPLPFTEQLFREAQYPIRPRDAFLGPTHHAKLGDSAGEIAAEPISPYPPGVPAVVPGQRITPDIIDFLQTGIAAGMYVEGASDPSLKEVRVVDAG